MVRCTVLPLGDGCRGEGGALFSRCSLLPVIKSPSEQEQLTMQEYEETQISSINRTDNISYPGVCVFFSSTSQTGAHFSAPSLVTHVDLRRVTWVPAERGRRASRCLWKTRPSLLSPCPIRQTVDSLGFPSSAAGVEGNGEGSPFSVLRPDVSFLCSLQLISY